MRNYQSQRPGLEARLKGLFTYTDLPDLDLASLNKAASSGLGFSIGDQQGPYSILRWVGTFVSCCKETYCMNRSALAPETLEDPRATAQYKAFMDATAAHADTAEVTPLRFPSAI